MMRVDGMPGSTWRGRVGALVVAVLVATLAVVAAPATSVEAAPPAFVQARALEINGGTVNSTSFTNANTAGNLIVVYVVWSNAGTVSVSDTRGNTYAPAQAATRWNNNQWSAQVFYAKDIAAGANVVRATFGTTINAWGIVYAHEYSGLDRNNPLDVSRSAVGTGAAMTTGNATTTNANDLIFGAGASTNAITAAGAGLTTRSTAYANRTMDRTVTTAGNYAVTGTQNGFGWVLQLVAFRAAPTDTVAPTAPTGLTATPVSVSRVNLAWTAATDNIAVTGYRILRNGTQIGTSATTSFSDTTATPATAYTYTVTAVDAAGNVSPPSAPAPATTPADTTPPSVPGGLTATATSPSQVSLAWTASTDNVAVTGYDVLRDGTVLTTVGSTSYINTGLTAGATYSYTVRARDAAGNLSAQSTPAPVTTPAPDTTAPTVDISAPTAGATVSATVAVGANAADNVGVFGVQFLLDGAPLNAEDTTAPYATSWDTTATPNGNHQLTARARDAAGNSTTSAVRNVTVTNTAPPPTGGLVAGYAFDASAGTTAADASASGITGTLANGAGWAGGKYGNAVALAGDDDVVSLGNPTALRLTGSMTISAWINSAAFPGDDAAVVSKRGTGGFQLDTTIDTGPRVIGFKLTTGAGGSMFRYGATAMQANTWYHITGVYDATARTMHVYLNGVLDDGPLQGTVAADQQDSPQNVVIGQRPNWAGFGFNGRIDDVRIYNRALTAAEVLADLGRPLGSVGSSDTAPPLVTMTAPAPGAQVGRHRHRDRRCRRQHRDRRRPVLRRRHRHRDRGHDRALRARRGTPGRRATAATR